MLLIVPADWKKRVFLLDWPAILLVVATPPNAIVFGSGYVTIPQMMRAGLVLNLLGVLVIRVTTSLIVKFVFS